MAAVQVDPSKVHAFADERSFEAWLRKNGAKEREVWIKIHKVRSGLRSITTAQAIDVALCWGWIDGIRKAYDDESFLQRFTPRSKKSVWSQINVANVERLTKARRMQPPGVAEVMAARADGRWAVACQNCQRAMSACFFGSLGQSVLPGFFEATYCMMARLSQSLKSPSTSVGTLPFGLRARKSGAVLPQIVAFGKAGRAPQATSLLTHPGTCEWATFRGDTRALEAARKVL